MDITPLSSTNITLPADSITSVERIEDVELFNNMLLGQYEAYPEEVLMTSLQEKSLAVSDTISHARATEDVLNNPATMLRAQSFLKNAMVEVDFIAKVTGQLSQGINKLVSMQ
ncbi:type III secretion system inner rod subunit SctI [Providencia rettgeri]|uniref:type III secretion system inner rod subunit SctI n=1 Tax=Providencia rettgeri TaxID=587 RepID=UPI0034E0C915